MVDGLSPSVYKFNTLEICRKLNSENEHMFLMVGDWFCSHETLKNRIRKKNRLHGTELAEA